MLYQHRSRGGQLTIELWDWQEVKETDFGDRMDVVQMNDEKLVLMFEGGSPQVLQAMLGEESSIDGWLHLPRLGKWIARVAVVPLESSLAGVTRSLG